MAKTVRLEVPIKGMDCAQCAHHVEKAIAQLPGVSSVEVLLSAERAVVHADPKQVDLGAIRQAVLRAGYAVPERVEVATPGGPLPRRFTWLLVVVFAVVVAVVVGGNGLGFLASLTR